MNGKAPPPAGLNPVTYLWLVAHHWESCDPALAEPHSFASCAFATYSAQDLFDCFFQSTAKARQNKANDCADWYISERVWLDGIEIALQLCMREFETANPKGA